MQTRTIWILIALTVTGIAIAAFFSEKRLNEKSAAYEQIANSQNAITETDVPSPPPAPAIPNAAAANSNSSANPKSNVATPTSIELCTAISTLANSIMTKRQAGASMAEMMSATQAQDQSVREVSGRLVVAAFDLPRFSTPEVIDETVKDFENEVFLECIKARQTK